MNKRLSGQKYQTFTICFTSASAGHKKQKKNPGKQLLHQNEVSYDVIIQLCKQIIYFNDFWLLMHIKAYQSLNGLPEITLIYF